MTRFGVSLLAALALAGCTAPRPAPVATPGRGGLPPGYNPGADPTSDSMVRAVQHELRRLVYMKGPVDGVLGQETRNAIREFQRTHDMPVDGMPSIFLLDRLRATNYGY
ncbi:MAG TPA: peptidoglycan-binding domain-containing protein [Acetobacteraceae bacterium]|nr:peptidoglycan-binding domain-containing protein [Acetobacteraceae bacterium]